MKLRLPAEWEPQDGIMLTWPHMATDWQPWLHEVEPVYVDITGNITNYEPVLVICNDENHKEHVAKLLSRSKINPDRYTIHIAPSNDSWTRDHGPVTVYSDSRPVLLDFTFNGWGKKYPADKDNQITSLLHASGAFATTATEKINFVLEGGSIESDGIGTILTTTSCLLSPERNSGMIMTEITKKLSEYLGAQRIIWFNHGQLLGDDTDGHIDTLIRFINQETIMYVTTDDTENPNYKSLKLMADELLCLKQINGESYKFIPLPSPVIPDEGGNYLPASYANFLIINNAVLVPVYGVPSDKEVIKIFRDSFTDRKIIPVNCRPLIKQYGSLHCITMHLPEGVLHETHS